MADWNSFLEFSAYLTNANANLDKILKVTLTEIGLYLRKKIQSKYGVQQPGRPASNSATPLFKTGKLRSNVMNARYNKNTEVIYMNDVMSKIGKVHEYGMYIKMTDKMRKYLFAVVFKGQPKKSSSGEKKEGYIFIPPRPIRRNILDLEQGNIAKIIEKNFIIFK